MKRKKKATQPLRGQNPCEPPTGEQWSLCLIYKPIALRLAYRFDYPEAEDKAQDGLVRAILSYKGSISTFSLKDLAGPADFIMRLRPPADPIAADVWYRFSPEGRSILTGTEATDSKKNDVLVEELNRVIRGRLIDYFEPLPQMDRVRGDAELRRMYVCEHGSVILNRIYLETTFPAHFVRWRRICPLPSSGPVAEETRRKRRREQKSLHGWIRYKVLRYLINERRNHLVYPVGVTFQEYMGTFGRAPTLDRLCWFGKFTKPEVLRVWPDVVRDFHIRPEDDLISDVIRKRTQAYSAEDTTDSNGYAEAARSDDCAAVRKALAQCSNETRFLLELHYLVRLSTFQIHRIIEDVRRVVGPKGTLSKKALKKLLPKKARGHNIPWDPSLLRFRAEGGVRGGIYIAHRELRSHCKPLRKQGLL